MKDTKRISKKQNNVRFTGRFSATRGFMPNQPTLLTAFSSARISNNVQPASTGTSSDLLTEEPNTCNVPEAIEMSDSANDQENDEDDLQQADQFDHEEEFISDSLPEDSFLISSFQETQSRLSRENYPSEYARGTFWIEPMMLKKNKKAESFYQPRIFLWIPHLL
ncbi:hypothetical protein BD560DRAFT_385330, partial [Blakeslea trispora]